MEKTKKWTKEQSQAINARGRTILVSAAAGSGKTAVLVERVIGLITNKDEPIDADRLLVVTFTNAAAAEMRERIAKRVTEMIEENPLDENLQRQQMLLQNSHISTIHAFCLDLLRENFERLNIPPDFRIADSNEADLLKKDVLDEILEENYLKAMNDNDKDSFIKLSKTLSSSKDDKVLEETVLKLYEFSRSLDNSEIWLEDMSSMYKEVKGVKETVWGKIACEHIVEALKSCIFTHRQSIEIINTDQKLTNAYGSAYESDLALLTNALDISENGSWDELVSAIKGFQFEKLKALRKFEDDNLKEQLKSERDSVKKILENLGETLLCSKEDDFKKDIAQLSPIVDCLCSIVRELDERFFVAKIKKGILDFSDLEQLTLKLLVEKNSDKLIFTNTAKEISKGFDEILVDEYQDTNPAQDMIFKAVSNNGANLFMVGDVKQSIYSFRQARPEIFMENAKNCVPYEDTSVDKRPARIILGKNFRSRVGVTDAINFTFTRLMSEKFGGVLYDEKESLIAGASYFETDDSNFEIDIIDKKNYEGDEDSTELEARYIARKIKETVEAGFLVSDGGEKRKATYHDFCILLRSMTGRADKYIRALEEENIPAYAEINSGYLTAYEVKVMISLLRILDNPLQDVPLLSVLLSPLFGFTTDDVAKIRLKDRSKNLYMALLELSKDGDKSFDEFLALVDKLRMVAAVLPSDKLILRIYEDTGLLNIFEAMPNGEMKKANLRLLLQYARNYEMAGFRGLSGFIRFIDRLDSNKSDLTPASQISENANVVRVMSIHKSKGLEFPICFMAGLSKQFNSEDTKGTALFNPVCGFGAKVKDEKLNCRYSTLPREVVSLCEKKSMLSEEMRVLYVAMTRAKEKLIAVMTFSNAKNNFATASKIARSGNDKALAFDEMSAKNPAELLMSAMLLHPSCQELRSLCGGEFNVRLLECEKVSVNTINFKTLEKSEKTTEKKETSEEEVLEKNKILAKLKENLSYIYPLSKISTIPSKVSVSELVHKDRANFDATKLRPSFLSGEKLTPAEAGTALHAFMQYCDFNKISNIDTVKEEIDRLVNSQFILKEQGEAVSLKKVIAFSQSKIMTLIETAETVYKEFRFNIEVPAKELIDDCDEVDTKILLQGMADLVLIVNGEVIVVDYKTDNVADKNLLVNRYKKQLDYYSVAISKMLKQPVMRKFIYSFHLLTEIEV